MDVQVKFDNETVWLSLNQISELFDKDKSVISRHIKNVFKEGELERNSVVAKNATTASDGKTYQVEFFNLDVIISVGYRVNSKKGTQFRIWATNQLKEHLTKGYSLNEKRLKQLQQTIQLVKRASEQISNTDEAQGLMEVLADYSRALEILDDYDHQKLSKKVTDRAVMFSIDYSQAIKAIEQLRIKFGGSSLFGNEKDQSFKSSIAVIDQTFDGKDLYPSLEEKAANLLYLVTKNHSFSDGNKRIAAFLFLYFLERNRILYNANGEKRIADNALVALTLMIAVSKTEEKETIVKIIVNLINKKNNAR